LSEDTFWKSEPKKVIAIIDQKNETEKIKMKNLAIYIASYVWGKDPEEVTQTDGPVAGRDVPLDPALLRGFM
jgi:hypothetical protein